MESSTDAEPMMELATMLIIDHSDTLELEIPSRPKSVEPTITDNDKPVDSIKMSITNPKKRAAEEDEDINLDMPSTKRVLITGEALEPTLPASDAAAPSEDEDVPVCNYLRRQKRKIARSDDKQAQEGSVAKDIDSEDMDADHEDNKTESRPRRKKKKAQREDALKSQQAKESTSNEDKDPEEMDIDHEDEEEEPSKSSRSRRNRNRVKRNTEPINIDHEDKPKESQEAQKEATPKINKYQAKFIASAKIKELNEKISKCRELLNNIEAEAPHEIDAILRGNAAGARFARDRFNKGYYAGELKGRQLGVEKAMYKKGYKEGKAKACRREERKIGEREKLKRAGVDVIKMLKGMKALYEVPGVKEYLGSSPQA